MLLNASRTTVIRCPEDKAGSFSIPPGVTRISDYAFSGCGLSGLTIPVGVLSIGRNAFESCGDLPDLTIPASVTGIGQEAFRYCARTTAITVEPANQHYLSNDGVLFDSLQTTLIQCPGRKEGAYVVPAGVERIEDYAFHGCDRLTAVTFPESLTSIGDHAFGSCRGLTSIEIPEAVTHIGDSVFDFCMGLRELVLHDGILSIGHSAFSACQGLTHVVIPAGVTTIGSGAFSICTSLGSVVISSGVTFIGNNAFNHCDVLSVAAFLGDAPTLEYGVFLNAPPEFTICYLAGASGYASPTWEDHPAVEIDPAGEPIPFWLVSNGIPHDRDLNQDLNGDGVDLLVAYALNLDPRNASAGLPRPTVGPDTLSIDFDASAPGIAYSARTSADLRTWSAAGVTLSEPDPDGRRTASVSLTSPRPFLRLHVAQAPSSP